MFLKFVDFRFVIEILVVLFYLTILVVLITSKKRMFRAPFYIVFIVTGFFDVMTALATMYIRFDFVNKLGQEFEIIIRIAAFITGTNYLIHMVGNTLTAIIQWSAVCIPQKFTKIWSSRNLASILTLDVLICYLSWSKVLFNPFTYANVNGTLVRRGRTYPVEFFRWLSCVAAIVSIIISTSCLLKTSLALRKMTAGERKARMREESILIYIILNVIVVSLECAFELLSVLHVDTGDGFQAFLDEFFSYYFFVMMTMNAFTILLMSASTRKEVRRRCLFYIRRTNTGTFSDDTSGNPRVIRVVPTNTSSVTPRLR